MSTCCRWLEFDPDETIEWEVRFINSDICGVPIYLCSFSIDAETSRDEPNAAQGVATQDR